MTSLLCVSPLFIIFAAVLLLAQLRLPRQLVFLPLLVAVCHFKGVPLIQLGGAFSVWKLVILFGLFRAWREGRLAASPTQRPLDMVVAVWAVWMILIGFAHHPKDYNPITIRLSVVFDLAGAYLYARSSLRNTDDFFQFAKCLAAVILPLAFFVGVEKLTRTNVYEILAGLPQVIEMRDERVRASGAFGHSILLGTFAATSVPLLAALWRSNPRLAKLGIGSCILIITSTASSGPVLILAGGLMALGLWRWRTAVPQIRAAVILGLISLHIIMKAPVWYLLARIDIVGGSTGWHRAELINAAITHFNEWWLVGTDYTRHWIAYGVPWSKYHIDITNYFINMGVQGGVALMFCFIAILVKSFRLLGQTMQRMRMTSDPEEFVLWAVGTALFTHCLAFMSISYFDQNNVLFGMLVGTLPGICHREKVPVEPESQQEVSESPSFTPA